MICVLSLLGVALATEPQPPAKPEVPAVHQRMAEHYLGTTKARAAVLRGDLETAQAEGGKLAALTGEGLPASWAEQLALITQVGKELQHAPDLEDAGRALGQMVAVCADCHDKLKGGPNLSGDVGHPPEWTAGSHMPRHMWGAEWIWLGILANEDEAVVRGAKAIAEGEPINPTATRDPKIAEWDAALHATAQKMVDAPDLPSRRSLYGELVSGCGTCHRALEAEGQTP